MKIEVGLSLGEIVSLDGDDILLGLYKVKTFSKTGTTPLFLYF